jgi:hypothetical protein
VRSEIEEHYESARDAAIGGGASPEEASRMALSALGDPKIANAQYRRVLLTASEAKLLQQGNREARMVCSISWLQWPLLAVSFTSESIVNIAMCCFSLSGFAGDTFITPKRKESKRNPIM